MICCSIYKTLQTLQGNIDLDVFFEIEQGPLVTLFGASGAGKTTILRILAGLISAEKGRINFEDESWFDTKAKINLPPQKRRVGFVFQDYALFPNMTVKENLQYALEKGESNSIIEELMHVMDLEQLQKRKSDTLSGGQKQRVALARALVRKPKLLLLDEPLSALDSEMRLKLQDHILKLHKQFNLTTILVSHDFAEIYKMSDKIFMLESGKITKQGPISEILLYQKTGDFQFIGEVINIEKHNMLYVVALRLGDNIIKSIVSETEHEHLNEGDKVLISLQALNPVIKKIS
jgi:molybdate transport system ATP-binding protein